MKNTIHVFLSLIFIFFISTSILIAQKFETPKIEHYQLSNGLTVILCEDHNSLQAYGMIAVKAGSKDDPEDATGLAHYLEHMLFKGTHNMGTVNWEKEKPLYEKVISLYDQLWQAKDKKTIESLQKQINEASIEQSSLVIPNEYFKLLAELGAVGINAGTSFDYTMFLSSFPAIQLEKWLTFYSNSFQSPVFRNFQAELETVYEEYNMYKDRTNSRLNEEIMKNIFPNNPYGRPIIGLGEHLKKPSLRKLIDFYNTYYVPNNMGLILCGNFNSNDIKPYIEKTFGKLAAKEAPKYNKVNITPFNGRKAVTLKMTPFEGLQLVYRTAPLNSEDRYILSVCEKLLQNGQTGYLDKLIDEGKFSTAFVNNLSLNDVGSLFLMVIPNPQAYYKGTINPMFITTRDEYKRYVRELERTSIIAMEEAEKEVIEALQNLVQGNFTDKTLEGTKKMLINGFVVSNESIHNKANRLANMFIQGADANDFAKIPDKINAITKEDVIRVAKKYFGEKNYMAFILKRGKAKTDKLEKPDIKPLEFDNKGQSVFAQEFRALKSPEPQVRFVDFKNDAQKLQLKNDDVFYYSQNPVNDIFSLTIRFDVGNKIIKELDYAYLMNYAGGGGFNAQSFKAQMNHLNCSYSVSANSSYVQINLTGPESNFKQAANLINLLINKPVIYQNIVSSTMSREELNRNYEKTEVSIISDALVDYVLYGNESSYINRISLQALGKIKAEEVIAAFKNACAYSSTVFCSGNWNSAEVVKSMFESTIQLSEKPVKGNSPYIQPKSKIGENTIYFVHLANAKQSHINVLANGKSYDIKQDPLIRAFNFYLSGGFNGLMLQEIREKRSMAYGVSANYIPAPLTGKDSYFTGDMSTQDDKTTSSVTALLDLLRNLPQYPDRVGSIKEYLTWSSVFGIPGYRGMGYYVDSRERLGYTEDPTISLLSAYKALEFNDIVQFWKDNIKDKPMAVTIVGDKSRINLKELEKFGKVVEVNVSNLFSKDD